MKSWRLTFLAALAAMLVVGCASIKPVPDHYHFEGLRGSEVKTVRPTLLFRLEQPRQFQPHIQYDLYDRSSSNDWREDGWIPAGSTLRILEVNRYRTDARGRWIGVVGILTSPTEGDAMFLYTWSLGRYLMRAPWEGAEIPETRDIFELVK